MGKKLTQEELNTRLLERNIHIRNKSITILSPYTGMNHNITCYCSKCNTTYTTIATSLYNGSGCPKCGFTQTVQKQRKTDKDFQKELAKLRTSGYKVYCNDLYVNNITKLTFSCDKGHTWQATPAGVLSGRGCPYCSNKKILQGFNDLATTNPYMFSLLANKSDGYIYTQKSNKRINFKCPDCGAILNKQISNVYYRGLRCPYCSASISYPNRLGRAIFDQLLPNSYYAEYSPSWAGSYVYDIYFNLNGLDYLIEWDGLQHYEDRGHFKQNHKNQVETDKIKTELAAKHNNYLIRIDCKKSDLNYIRQNIECSELSSLFDLSKINWTFCNKQVQTNIVKRACDLWMSGHKSFSDLAQILHIGNSTARDYINRGAELGWCDYDSKAWITKQSNIIKTTKLDTGTILYSANSKACVADLIAAYNIKMSPTTVLKYARLNSDFNDVHFELVK